MIGSNAGVDDGVHTPGNEIALAIEMVDCERAVLCVVRSNGCGEYSEEGAGGELHVGCVVGGIDLDAEKRTNVLDGRDLRWSRSRSMFSLRGFRSRAEGPISITGNTGRFTG